MIHVIIFNSTGVGPIVYTIQHVSVERMHVSNNKMKSLKYLSTNLIDMTFFCIQCNYSCLFFLDIEFIYITAWIKGLR